MKNDTSKNYFTVSELSNALNISRVAVFKKIKNGQIKAEKMGRNYVIFKKDLNGIVCDELTNKLKKEIEKGVTKVVEEYGDVLKKLGKE